MAHPRLVLASKAKAKLLSPRQCMARVWRDETEEECGASPEGWFYFADDPDRLLSLCQRCRKAFGCVLPSERRAAAKDAEIRQSVILPVIPVLPKGRCPGLTQEGEPTWDPLVAAEWDPFQGFELP